MRWWRLPRECPQLANTGLETVRHVVDGCLGYAVRSGLPAPTREDRRHTGRDVTRLGETQTEEVENLERQLRFCFTRAEIEASREELGLGAWRGVHVECGRDPPPGRLPEKAVVPQVVVCVANGTGEERPRPEVPEVPDRLRPLSLDEVN